VFSSATVAAVSISGERVLPPTLFVFYEKQQKHTITLFLLLKNSIIPNWLQLTLEIPSDFGIPSTTFCIVITVRLSLRAFQLHPSLNHSLNFFCDKIANLRACISPTLTSPHLPGPAITPPVFDSFRQATVGEISSIIKHSPDKQCDLDPLPTALLKRCLPVLATTVTNIVNLSLSTGDFPTGFKQAIVSPLIKKPSLDKENLSNYRPISNLSFLSKLTERVVHNRLDQHLSQNSLYNSHQSAYTKFHSTETALLSVHNSLTQAIAKQQVSCLLWGDACTVIDCSVADFEDY